MTFLTPEGIPVPSVTAEQMRLVDRIAIEEFRLGILQMMENAGRSVAQLVMAKLGDSPGPVCVLAGSGGNGGGGICCARHLHNHGVKINLAISKPTADLGPATTNQLAILQRAGIEPVEDHHLLQAIQSSKIVVDALIGYSLRGAPRGKTAEMITHCNQFAQRVISLDLPSGLDATTGASPGVNVEPDTIMTLALPKTGLAGVNAEIYLADIGIPPELFAGLGIDYESIFKGNFLILLTRL